MRFLTALPQQAKSAARFIIRLYHPETLRAKGILWSLGLGLATLLAAMLLLMFYWSREPAIFDVQAVALERAEGEEQRLVPGFITTATVMHIADTLLHKPGGYLTNDVSVPGILMDNMPSWEFGVLIELRDVIRALRNDFSRAQTQSGEDLDLRDADAQFHFDHTSWVLPMTESEYESGIEALGRYLQRLQAGQSQFFVRADNLNAYLAVVEKRLGDYAFRLSTNVRELRYTPEGSGSTDAAPAGEITANTPWMEIDNVFFEGRGYVWAMLHVLKAIEMDFAPVLESKKAIPTMRRIVHKLKRTQQRLWSPLIMNNSGFGIFTNHSLIMASYLSRANAAIIDLRLLLLQG